VRLPIKMTLRLTGSKQRFDAVPGLALRLEGRMQASFAAPPGAWRLTRGM